MTIGNCINVLGIIAVGTEIALLISKRAKGEQDIVTDARSLQVIWRTIGIGIGLTLLFRALLPHPVFTRTLFEYVAGLLVLGGMALRWISIFYLGREFTVQVAIIEGHRLTTNGPYRLIRHPSYAGLLLIFLGLAIHSNHPVGIIALTLPVFWAISNRIRIEERAMESYFGVEYAEYRKRTNKLIPHVY
ncbi:MAG: isoprenylcysteine carboxylmethyltransferase family protein [Desulfobacteraceae bacterium]|nr:isoprenylcysteine carboxylmethyltransferase family protein [Desulfobacteraceae bacterium]